MIRRSSLMTTLVALFFAGSLFAQVSVSTKLPATALPGGSFNVELNVSKGDVSGFAKLQQILPTGFTATAGETANATFSFKDRKVKFLWMALPNNDFKVSYKVNIDPEVSGNQIIEGSFAYIKDNETEKFIIPKDIIAIQADQAAAEQQAALDQVLADQKAKEEAAEAARSEAEEVAEVVEEVAEEGNPKVETTEVVETTEEVTEVVEEVAEEVVEEVADNSQAEADAAAAELAKKEAETKRKLEEAKAAKEAAEAKKAQEEADRAAAAEASAATEEKSYNDAMMKSKPGLVFRVQVAAGPNRVDPSFFQNKYGISEAISIEEHEGLFKYVVGEFGSYRPAKTFSNELRDNNSVDGPFVTSYNDGTRIHVREALDIAGQ